MPYLSSIKAYKSKQRIGVQAQQQQTKGAPIKRKDLDKMLTDSLHHTGSNLRLHELEEIKNHKGSGGKPIFQVQLNRLPVSPSAADSGYTSPSPAPPPNPRRRTKEPLLRLKKNLSSLRKNQSKLNYYLDRANLSPDFLKQMDLTNLSPDNLKQISKTLVPSPMNSTSTNFKGKSKAALKFPLGEESRTFAHSEDAPPPIKGGDPVSESTESKKPRGSGVAAKGAERVLLPVNSRNLNFGMNDETLELPAMSGNKSPQMISQPSGPLSKAK